MDFLPQSDARLWQATEDDSNRYSLPWLVQHLRRTLSANRQFPITWEDLVRLGKKAGVNTGPLDPASPDLCYAVYCLATVWARQVYPYSKKDLAFQFGQVIVELYCQNMAVMGQWSDRQRLAHQTVERLQNDPWLKGLPPEGQANVVFTHVRDVMFSSGPVL